jgi:PleD family two-component response regulator
MKILVVDDSPFMRQAVVKALSETKYKTAEIAQAGTEKRRLNNLKPGGSIGSSATGTCRDERVGFLDRSTEN